MLVIRDAGRLDGIVAGAITGDNKMLPYNAVKHLARISDKRAALMRMATLGHSHLTKAWIWTRAWTFN